MKRLFSLLLLPLSALPLILAVPLIASAHRNFERRNESGPLPAPAVVAPARVALGPAKPGVPVLAYENPDRHAFAEQIAALDEQGFHAIGIDDYLRWRADRGTRLPHRPILVTFDGALLDAYRDADAVLREHGFRATMFVPTGAIPREPDTRLSWRELHAMAASGRWDVQVQAHDGYIRVATGPDGATAPFYTVRRYTRSGGQESFADYEQRVTLDLFTAKQELDRQGFAPRAIALPFGDDGRDANDPRVRPLLSRLLDRQFDAVFVSPQGRPARFSRRHGRSERFVVGPDITTGRLLDWLRRG